MTYLSENLDGICRKWCPLINNCEAGRYCKHMQIIRKEILEIVKDGGEILE